MILELDHKSDFFSGRDVTARIERIVTQIRSTGTVASIHVADRLNKKYSPTRDSSIWRSTDAVLHQKLPGVPVLVNIVYWQLTGGCQYRRRAVPTGGKYQYEIHSTLDQFYRSGNVDGSPWPTI